MAGTRRHAAKAAGHEEARFNPKRA